MNLSYSQVKIYTPLYKISKYFLSLNNFSSTRVLIYTKTEKSEQIFATSQYLLYDSNLSVK